MTIQLTRENSYRVELLLGLQLGVSCWLCIYSFAAVMVHGWMRVYTRVVGRYEYSRTRRGGGRCVWREGGGWALTH